MTQPHPATPFDPSIGQELALLTAATRLARGSTGVINQQTIERFFLSCYDQFATTATITGLLPLPQVNPGGPA